MSGATFLGVRGHERVAGATLVLLAGASVAFLLGSDIVRWLVFFAPLIVIAGYAGWVRAGWISAVVSVFLGTLWWFAFGPYVGYLRGLNSERYTTPRMKPYETTVTGELRLGIESGIVWGALLALTLGTAAYIVGVFLRQEVGSTADDG